MKDKHTIFISQVTNALTKCGATNVTNTLSPEGDPIWEFVYQSYNKIWQLALRYVEWSQYNLPRVFWRFHFLTPPWGFPHISAGGEICISENEGLSFDPDNIDGIVEYVVKHAIKLLENNAALTLGKAQENFSAELEAYLKLIVGNNISDTQLTVDPNTNLDLYAEIRKEKGKSIITAIVDESSHSPKITLEKVFSVQIHFSRLPPLTKLPTVEWFNEFKSKALEAGYSNEFNNNHNILLVRVPNKYGEALFVIQHDISKFGTPNSVRFCQTLLCNPNISITYHYAHRW